METGIAPDVAPQGLPDQSTNQVDGWDPRVADRIAKEIADGHRQRKQNLRQHNLEAEKLLVHLVASQWADIINGSRVGIPNNIGGGLRLQANYLRPLVDNHVAYHTSQDFQVLAEPKADRESRDRAKVDTILVNSVLKRQRVNEVFGEAMWMASCTGFCPVHAMWRTDLTSDLYQPIYDTHLQQFAGPLKGFVDIWTGDPFDMVFNEAAQRRSIQWLSYGRILPTRMLRQVFAHVPGIDGLGGSRELGSASRTQRILKSWEAQISLDHGSSVVYDGHEGDELSAVICREIAPGIDPDFPDGSLEVVALKDTAETDEDKGGAMGRAMLLHQGPLPGKRFSCVNVYTGHAGDDVLGRAYLKDIDEAQTSLNQVVTLEMEYMRRFSRPPLKVLAGDMVDDTVITDDDALMEFLTPEALAHTGFLLPPVQGSSIFKEAKQDWLEYMFRVGGWQAASRGEGDSGDSGVKVRFMARADDSIHALTRRGMTESLIELCQVVHALCRENMLVPEDIRAVTGDDVGYLAEPFVDRSKLSDEPPQFRVVSGFGATPEDTANQLVTLVQMTGADGQPLLDTETFWKRYPDTSLRPPEITAQDMKEARVQTINYTLQQIVRDLRKQYGPNAGQMLQAVKQAMDQQFPILPDDVPQMRIEALSMLSQDEQEDPMVRLVARMMQGDLSQMLQQAQVRRVEAAQQAQPQRPNRPQPPRGLPSPTNPGDGLPSPEPEAVIA